MIGSHGRVFAMFLFQIGKTAFEPIGKGVGQSNQLAILIGMESLVCRTRAASAAADATDLQQIIAGRMCSSSHRQTADQPPAVAKTEDVFKKSRRVGVNALFASDRRCIGASPFRKRCEQAGYSGGNVRTNAS